MISIAQNPSGNHGGALDRVRAIVMHYTANARADAAIAWLRTPASKASAHFVIDQQGNVTQLVSVHRVAWHAGESEWTFANGDRVVGLNHCSIGIELVYEGPVSHVGQKYIGAGGEYRNVLLAPAKHDPAHVRAWPQYPDAQIAAAIELVHFLKESGTAPADVEILGHDDIAPRRKIDPGPAFPWVHFRKAAQA